MLVHAALLLSSCLFTVDAQAPPARVQTNTFNSSFHLSKEEISKAHLSKANARTVEIALNFERSNWAGQSVNQAFYKVPKGSKKKPFGALLKKEDYTSTEFYTLPPEVSLSRFLFQSETVNGTTVPASAYILWPYTARKFDGVKGVPVVAFGHGNSGYMSECAPSHIRNLWYHFSTPFELALAGYAVVAPDYVGLGVHEDEDGKQILPEWLANPSGGNDLIGALEAARSGWSELSNAFVIMGHSQGGGAAWGAAQRLAKKPVRGYLGTIAGSPITNIYDTVNLNGGEASSVSGFLPAVAHSLKSIFPAFKLSDFLTDVGIARLHLQRKIRGCNSVTKQLYTDAAIVIKKWKTKTSYFKDFSDLTENGGKEFAGPMLVLQGTVDTAVPEPITSAAVKKTCQKFPKNSLHYIKYNGVDHVPVLYSSRMVWMDWIADRFKGTAEPHGCKTEEVSPVRKLGSYQKEIGFFIEYGKYLYSLS